MHTIGITGTSMEGCRIGVICLSSIWSVGFDCVMTVELVKVEILNTMELPLILHIYSQGTIYILFETTHCCFNKTRIIVNELILKMIHNIRFNPTTALHAWRSCYFS